jgi:nicotinate-nucleotide pyrophosphorylase (carboxylating)
MFYGLARLIDLALQEDIGTGDVTTACLIPAAAEGQAFIVAKEALIVAGIPVAQQVFQRLDRAAVFAVAAQEGQAVAAGTTLMTITGRLAALLTGERTALNFLQRLAGIATHVHQFLELLPAQGPRLVDTRKTTPGWRALEKYAVRLGGAANHRFSLADGILIKDNHIAACGGVAAAVRRARQQAPHSLKIEVEVGTQAEVEEALAAGVDIIMLDNMSPPDVRRAVARIKGRALVEVSGGINRQNLAAYADCGADLISCGALTHSAQAVDISMRIQGAGTEAAS